MLVSQSAYVLTPHSSRNGTTSDDKNLEFTR